MKHPAIVVDDERIARRDLAYLLRDVPEIEVVAEAASVDEAEDLLRRLKPELVFLDIQMPGGSGFELFDRIDVHAHVVFVTAFDEFALRAFEVNALDYLTKPVKPERLRHAIDRYLKRVSTERPPVRHLGLSDSILITIDRTPRFVKVCSIECILAEGDYSKIICATGSAGLVLKSMKEWEQILPQKYFCRIQRSTIVNCEQIARFQPNPNRSFEVYMKHFNAPLTMTRRFARQFRARYEI